MKNLLIALSLVSSLIAASNVKADTLEGIVVKEVETLVVASVPEVANFEIYSLTLTEAAMESMMESVNKTLSTPLSSISNNLSSAAIDLNSQI